MKAMAIEKHMRFKTVQAFLSAINGEKKVLSLVKEKRRRHTKRFVGIAIACLVLLISSILVYNVYLNKQKNMGLDPANIVVWYSVSAGSSESEAMQAIKTDFEQKHSNVTVTFVPIAEAEYSRRLIDAANQNQLPTLFESTGVPEYVLNKAVDLDNVLESEQFKSALFLNQYGNYYNNKKQVPLGIEIPMAYVITNGATCIQYTGKYFNNVANFNNNSIAYDDRYIDLLQSNFVLNGFYNKETFLNNSENTSAVLLSSTMELNEVRTTLTNYEKTYVYYDTDKINCKYVYEWSIGNGNKAEIKAAERLLSWMLGNVYQSYLMITECNDGQIPVNAKSFESKIQLNYLAPISEIYKKFVFEREVFQN